MKMNSQIRAAFTLIEMMVVLGILGILLGLLLPAVGSAKRKATRTACFNNLKQINIGIHMYCDDSSDVAPSAKYPAVAYKELLKNYLGSDSPSSIGQRTFACPSDTFHFCENRQKKGSLCLTNSPQHLDGNFDYSSYWFNGMNVGAVPRPGIAGFKLSSIAHPSRTILVAEAPAYFPYSWHEPKPDEGPMFPDAKNIISFVDGHSSLIKIYWNDLPGHPMACELEPPAAYEYRWTGD